MKQPIGDNKTNNMEKVTKANEAQVDAEMNRIKKETQFRDRNTSSKQPL